MVKKMKYTYEVTSVAIVGVQDQHFISIFLLLQVRPDIFPDIVSTQ